MSIRRALLTILLLWAVVLAAGALPPAQEVRAGSVPTGLSVKGWQAIQDQVAKLTADDGAPSDYFGFSVGVDGDTAVVGAIWADVGGNSQQGAAYVFYRDQGGPNAWGQVAKLTAADGAYDDQFGYGASVSGDTAMVGALNADVGGNQQQGAAYVFGRNQGGTDAWGQIAKLTASDGMAGDKFGFPVSVDGDMAVIGASGAGPDGNHGRGAAYIFYESPEVRGTWNQVAKLTAADGVEGDELGWSVSVNGDTAVVGAHRAAVGGNPHQGAAYVFLRDQGGADTWGQVAKLTAADGADDDQFGYSASVRDDTVLVGAVTAGVPGHGRPGAVYVFDRNEGGPDAWGQVTKLTAADGADGDEFGHSVSLSGGTAVVGADTVDLDHTNQGAAYVFYRNLGGADAWGQVTKLTAADGGYWDLFGFCASVSGDTAVVGAYYHTAGGKRHQGAAYVFRVGPLGFSVSGRVQDAGGVPLAGVLVSATGGYSAVTGSAGGYSITGLPAGSYDLTPTLEGFRFEPPTRTVILPPDGTDQDFVGFLARLELFLPLVLRAPQMRSGVTRDSGALQVNRGR